MSVVTVKRPNITEEERLERIQAFVSHFEKEFGCKFIVKKVTEEEAARLNKDGKEAG